MLAKVKYQVATHSGTIDVLCSENSSNAYIIARAKKQLAPIPFGYESFKVIERIP